MRMHSFFSYNCGSNLLVFTMASMNCVSSLWSLMSPLSQLKFTKWKCKSIKEFWCRGRDLDSAGHIFMFTIHSPAVPLVYGCQRIQSPLWSMRWIVGKCIWSIDLCWRCSHNMHKKRGTFPLQSPRKGTC